MSTTKVKRRELLQLAKPFDPDKHKIAGRLISEKLDGTRCFWDGGITRGMKTIDVPYAGIYNPKKPTELKAKIKPVATGLWSRYGNPIIAPDWFLDQLPQMLLDGELWAGRGNFQTCRSICAGDTPDPRFDQIRYAVYGCPSPWRMFDDGLIKNSQMVRQITMQTLAWCLERIDRPGFFSMIEDATFADEYEWLTDLIGQPENLAGLPDMPVFTLPQVLLDDDEATAREQIDLIFKRVLMHGGEGVVMRDPNAIWTPKRTPALYKWKPYKDDEAVITGYTSGRETDKGSKHLGKIGAIITDYDGKRLELSGLTDAEREFQDAEWADYARSHPGEDMPPGAEALHFAIGDRITFKYRELSDDGIPKEGSYFRKRGNE